jgi:hypothetical protein
MSELSSSGSSLSQFNRLNRQGYEALAEDDDESNMNEEVCASSSRFQTISFEHSSSSALPARSFTIMARVVIQVIPH